MRYTDRVILHQFQHNGLIIAILTKGDSNIVNWKASLVECQTVKWLVSELLHHFQYNGLIIAILTNGDSNIVNWKGESRRMPGCEGAGEWVSNRQQ